MIAMAMDSNLLEGPTTATNTTPLARANNRAEAHRLALEKAQRIKGFEDEILENSLAVVSGAMAFMEIDADTSDEDMPASFIEKCGGDIEKAKMRMRLARSAWMSRNEAPAGLDMAVRISTNIIRARAVEKAGPRVLNVGVVQMSAPLPVFDTIDVEAE